MGSRNGPYNPSFPVGAIVRIADRSVLEKFHADGKRRHRLQSGQIEYAGEVARVEEVDFCYGGERLYSLEGVPGLWDGDLLSVNEVAGWRMTGTSGFISSSVPKPSERGSNRSERPSESI